MSGVRGQGSGAALPSRAAPASSHLFFRPLSLGTPGERVRVRGTISLACSLMPLQGYLSPLPPALSPRSTGGRGGNVLSPREDFDPIPMVSGDVCLTRSHQLRVHVNYKNFVTS